MSDAVSALAGAQYQGFVTVKEAGLRGMVTLRGDLSDAKLIKCVKALTGLAVPTTGAIAQGDVFSVAWMSPDELLIMLPYEDAQAATTGLCDALKNSHHLAVNVSDARAVFSLTGVGGRDVLAKLSPADLSVAGFGRGQIRRSRLAQVPAAFWFSGEDQIDLVCFRSVAQYAFNVLKTASMPGSEVGLSGT
ncbi:MAG: sarcosine oxidase subunit gamma family protein [Paracoccaceae bacterium]